MTDQTTTPSRTPVPTTSTPESRGKGDEVRHRAGEAAGAGKQEAGRVVDEARTHTSRLIGETGDRAREHADEQLGRTAGVIERFGSELDGMAANSPEPDGYLAALARDGAHTAHQLSRRMETGGLDGVMDDVKRFARRRPGTFLAASFAVGIVLGRVTRNADLGQIKQDVSGNGNSSSVENRPQTPIGVPPRSPATSGTGGPTTTPGIRP